MIAPKVFDGTPAQAAANRATHHFVSDDGDVRCAECDCRPYGRVASYACGASVPRVEEPANNYLALGAALFAAVQ